MSIEKQLVSTLISNPGLISALTVTQDEFTDPRVARIFGAVTGLIREGKEPDIILLAETMNFESDENWLPEISDVYDQPAAPSNLASYETIIRRNSRNRALRFAARSFVDEVEHDNPAASHNVLEAVRKIDSGNQSLIKRLDEFTPAVIQHIDDVEQGRKTNGLTTGLKNLNAMIGGLMPGDQIVLCARTNIGKTAMMVNLAVNAGEPCLIISAEQGGEQINQRVMAKMGGISAYRLRMGKLEQDEYGKLARAAEDIKKSEILIVDKSRPSIDEIEQLARAAKWRYGIKAVFIDYLQLINHPTEKDKRLQIVDISKRGKELAKELDIPIVWLAQLNRNAEGRKPLISDLKESGSIEEDADTIIVLYPAKDDGGNLLEGQLTVDLQKHRHGPKGWFNCRWNPEFMRAEDL